MILERIFLDPRNNHLFGLSKQYFHKEELKLMIQGQKKPSKFTGKQGTGTKFGIIREPASVNFNAVDFFQELDISLNTAGWYPTNGGRQGIQINGRRTFFVEYCNHDFQIIIDWNEEFYRKNWKYKEHSLERQKTIQTFFTDYLFFRVDEKAALERGSDKFISVILKKLKK